MQRILVAGIGNIFLGDDGFGVEVARRLMEWELPEGVLVKDFGIRGMDLVYALLEEHDVVVFIDSAQRGDQPGTLYLIEPRVESTGEVTLDTHAMDPVKVLKLAQAMGAKPTRTYVVGCEPEHIPESDDPDVHMELSLPVQAAVQEAATMVTELVQRLSMVESGAGARL
jgi:hydrogenase maturation protease